MNRRPLVRLALVLALVAGPIAAQNALEVITLRHATAEQVLPALRPLLEPGATLSGQGNRLFVRTSPANLDDLRLALEALDRRARRLQISVRFDASREAAAARVEAGGRVGSRGSSLELRAHESRSGSAERIDQRVRVLEGARAVIYSGRSRPVRRYVQTPAGVIPQQVTIVEDEATGFAVVPRLSGRLVHLDIAAQGAAQHTATTVQAELGQWIELGRASSAGAYRTELQGVWLKVEEAPD